MHYSIYFIFSNVFIQRMVSCVFSLFEEFFNFVKLTVILVCLLEAVVESRLGGFASSILILGVLFLNLRFLLE